MERLTKRDTDGQAMMDCEKCKADWTGKHGKPMADCTALYCRNRLLDRLVKYEDTELEPEEIEKLRGQLPRWIPVEERLPELQSWGASTVVLGLIKIENAPSMNKLHDLTLCVYCDNGIWSMPGRYVAITHWMPLPEPPEVENAETK